MPVCPQCGVDYGRGFSWCARCDVTLVEELPQVPDDGQQLYQEISEVPLGTFDNRLELRSVHKSRRAQYLVLGMLLLATTWCALQLAGTSCARISG